MAGRAYSTEAVVLRSIRLGEADRVLHLYTEAHGRVTFDVRGPAPVRLPCLLDGSGQFGEAGVYGAPSPGSSRYSIGVDGHVAPP